MSKPGVRSKRSASRCQIEVDRLRSERNANAKAVGMAKGKGTDASELIARGEALTGELATAEQALTAVQEEQTAVADGFAQLAARVGSGWRG